jgi:hypothetical protein
MVHYHWGLLIILDDDLSSDINAYASNCTEAVLPLSNNGGQSDETVNRKYTLIKEETINIVIGRFNCCCTC